MKRKCITPIAVLILFYLFGLSTIHAQTILPLLRLEDDSPRSSVSHQIGITNVKIDYHSPRVKERKIWGGVVTYGRTWRAGANEITTIEFQHDVRINQQSLTKGKYGFIILPQENEFTLIFTKNTTAWGNFSYTDADAVLRVSVKPEALPAHYEWLKYEFNSPTDSTVQASLCWEKLRIPFTIEVNTKENVLRVLREDWLTSPHRFDWLGWWYAASYLNSHNLNLPEALEWVDRSIAAGPNFSNLRLKSEILTKLNKPEEAKVILDKALSVGTVYDIDTYVIILIREKKEREALVLAKKNAANYPGFWETNQGLARAYSANGDFSRALRHAKLVRENVTGGRKTFWENAISKLEQNQNMN